MDDEIRNAAHSLVERIGLPAGMLDELRSEDDWSFIVKSSALLETALGFLIVQYLDRPNADKLVRELTFRKKLNFICSLDLLPGYQKFIEYVSKVRNTVVHDIRRTSFTFREHIATHDDAHRFFSALPGVQADEVPSPEVVAAGAKPLIWFGLIGVLAMAYSGLGVVEIERQLEEARRALEKVLGADGIE